jgi:hypothetical protein
MEMQQRIDRLEKERWLYLILAILGALAGLSGAWLGASGRAKGQLTAQSLTLRPTKGHAITVYDAKGKVRATLGVDDGGQLALAFFDERNKKARQSLGLSSNGNPQIQLFNEDGNPRGELKINDLGVPRLEFSDAAGVKRQTMGIEEALGISIIELFGPDGKGRAVLKEDLKGASLTLYDATGKQTFIAPQGAK